MRVVDHRREAGPRDLLESPGWRLDRGEPGADHLAVDAERPCRASRHEDVLDVRCTDEPAGEPEPCPRDVEDAPRAGERGLDLERANIGPRAPPDRDRSRREAPEQSFTRRVVEVDDRHRIGLPATGKVLEEEARFGGVVPLQIAVKIEMIARQVGEHRCVEARAGHPVLRERVRRHLHRDVRRARGGHGGEEPLERRGIGGGEAGGSGRGSEAIGDCPDDSGPEASRPPDRLEEVGGRRLPVRAGHADEREARARVASQARRRLPQHPTWLIDPHHRGAGGGDVGRRDDRARPACDGLRHVPCAVARVSCECKEDVAGPHPPRVDRDSRHLDIPFHQRADLSEQFAQPHLTRGAVQWRSPTPRFDRSLQPT